MDVAIVTAFVIVAAFALGVYVGRDEERARRARSPGPAKCAPVPTSAPATPSSPTTAPPIVGVAVLPSGVPLFLGAPATTAPAIRPSLIARGRVMPNGILAHHPDDAVEFRRALGRINCVEFGDA